MRERETGSGTSSAPPPDMVQFSMKDGVPQFSFLQYAMANNGESPPQQQAAANTSYGANNSNLTLQLPMPTPVSNFQNAPESIQAAPQAVPQPMQAPAVPAVVAATTQQMQQFVAQQQQKQQASVVQQQAAPVPVQPAVPQQQQAAVPVPVQPQAQVLVQGQNGLQPNFATLFQQQANLFQQQSNMMQQQASQPQQQQQQQFNFTHDPNAFLQQLQVAQFQQMAVQAQQQAQAQASAMPAATGQSVQLQQQQMRAQFAQQQAQLPAPAPVAVKSSTTAARSSSGLPPAKRAKVTNKKAKTAPPKSKAMPTVSKSDLSFAAGLVSASDTDGETTKKARASKKAAAASKKAKLELPDMSDMTDAQKARANRDRNREHARNTRLRKKAYLEKLKTTVDDLCRERDTLVSERAGEANLLVEMHNTRTEVLMSFFSLRSSNEKRRNLWSSILEESCFTCVMPVTPYRSFPASEVQVSKCQRTLMGIDGMMADTASMHVLFDSLVDRSKHPHGKIEFRYTLVTEDAAGVGNQVMARWALVTTNAVECGARMEVAKQGMLCCKFNSAHKIVGVELMFDVMAFMLQLKQAAGSDSFSVIPNTVQTCQRSFDTPMVMTLADAPYTIVQVNKRWEEMTGYRAEEVVGKTSCGVLQGPKMDKKSLFAMMQEIRFKRPASSALINLKKTGEQFRQFVIVFPLSTDSRITHYMALTCHTDDGVDEEKPSPPVAVPAPVATLKAPAPTTAVATVAAPAPLALLPSGQTPIMVAGLGGPMAMALSLPQPVLSGVQGGVVGHMPPPPNAGTVPALQSKPSS